MATGYKTDAIIDKEGNQLILCEVNPSTYALATLTVDTYLFNLGHISESDVNQTASLEEYRNEAGEVVASSYEYTRKTTGTLMQTDKSLIELLANTVKGKTYLEGKYTGYVDSAHQWHFKIVKVTPQYSVKRPGGATSMPYESTGLKLSTLVSYSAADMVSIGILLTLSNFPTETLSIGAAQSFEVKEA